ncbi:helix-turn-helix domain-containing protein [Serratia quinivorans]|uniref:helix-turn-helix domain-containing protein n=1 Tax=Serratia quinivorans TaxID=137545 RepID=UPI0039828F14
MENYESHLILCQGDNWYPGAAFIGLVKPDTRTGVTLWLGDKENGTSCRLEPGEQMMFACLSQPIAVSAGRMHYFFALDFSALCKLQAFLDAASPTKPQTLPQKKSGSGWGFAPFRVPHPVSFKQIERWFITQSFSSSSEIENIASVLRASENYWLVSFLLQKNAECTRLTELGKSYGLSVSHFRRMARNALGNTTKSELNSWRMARTLLEFIEGKRSLTELAIKHGYASASHFSNDVRMMFGLSPRGLKNVIMSEAEK